MTTELKITFFTNQTQDEEPEHLTLHIDLETFYVQVSFIYSQKPIVLLI